MYFYVVNIILLCLDRYRFNFCIIDNTMRLYKLKILVNNQLDALSLMYLFISPLYMFLTAQCLSSGDQLY